MTHNLPDDAIEVARIAGAWGVKGSIRLNAYSVGADALLHAKRWYLREPEKKQLLKSEAIIFDVPAVLTVKKAQEQGKNIRADTAEITSPEHADILKGFRVFIRRSDFPKLKHGEFYWVDLIGLDVVNLTDENLGVVGDLMSNGPQSILRVRYEEEDKLQERLIPFVDAYVIEVDLEKQLIRVDWQLDY